MRMRRLFASLFAVAAAAAPLSDASANFAVTVGTGTTILAIDGANQGTALCAAASTECPAHVLINTAGAPIGVSGTPLFMSLAGTTLPAFAATPTFNLGTLNGAATQATLASVLSALGSPFQAGGSIGNASFGVSGTLPAFAATPTFNLGTIGSAATAANQNATAAGSSASNAQAFQGVTGGVPAPVTDTTVATAVTALACTQPCPSRQLGDQLTYEAWGGTSNASLTSTLVLLPSAGVASNLMRGECVNANTTMAYIQVFNAATTGAVTLGTTAPAKVIPCPPGNGTIPGVYDHEYFGVKFTAGIVVAATTTPTGSTSATVSASIGYATGN